MRDGLAFREAIDKDIVDIQIITTTEAKREREREKKESTSMSEDRGELNDNTVAYNSCNLGLQYSTARRGRGPRRSNISFARSYRVRVWIDCSLASDASYARRMLRRALSFFFFHPPNYAFVSSRARHCPSAWCGSGMHARPGEISLCKRVPSATISRQTVVFPSSLISYTLSGQVFYEVGQCWWALAVFVLVYVILHCLSTFHPMFMWWIEKQSRLLHS